MNLIYIVPVHNEAAFLEKKISPLIEYVSRNNENLIVLVENGSTDESWLICQRLVKIHNQILSFQIEKPGLGLAFQKGTAEVLKLNPKSDTLIIYTAADLPFLFTDIEQYLFVKDNESSRFIGVGSKFHSKSIIHRSLPRTIISFGFFCIRALFLRLFLRDSQGSILAPVDISKVIFPKLKSEDYFFSTEFLYYCKKINEKIIELPIKMEKDNRPSRVHILRDSFKMFVQIVRLSFREL